MIKPWGPHAVSALWCQLKRRISSPCWVLPPVPIPKSLNLQTRKLCQRVQYSWTMDGWRPRLRLGSSGRPPAWWDGEMAHTAVQIDGRRADCGGIQGRYSLLAGRREDCSSHRTGTLPGDRTTSTRRHSRSSNWVDRPRVVERGIDPVSGYYAILACIRCFYLNLLCIGC
jgi:hypothetical protein